MSKEEIDQDFFSKIDNISKFNLKKLMKLRQENPNPRESLWDIKDRYEKSGLTINDYVDNRDLFYTQSPTIFKKIMLVIEKNLESYNFSFRLSVDNTHMPYQINNAIHYEERIPDILGIIEMNCKMAMNLPLVHQLKREDVLKLISKLGYVSPDYLAINYYTVNNYNKFYRVLNVFKAKTLKDISVSIFLKESLLTLKINKSERFNGKLIYIANGVVSLAIMQSNIFSCLFQSYKGNIVPIEVKVVTLDEFDLLTAKLRRINPPFIYMINRDIHSVIIYRKMYYRPSINERTIVTATIKIVVCDHLNDNHDESDEDDLI
jgi:Mor family transcriptional regulator